MAPDTARRVSALLGTGRLSVHAGQVRAVTAAPGTLRVRIEQEAGASPEHEAGWLVNATGPDGDITRTRDPLLRDLLRRGLARPDPLRLGLDATPSGAVLDSAGRPSGTLFTLGPPLRGLWYETTAIPEIRTRPPPWPCASPQRPRCPPARHRRLTSGRGLPPIVEPPRSRPAWSGKQDRAAKVSRPAHAATGCYFGESFEHSALSTERGELEGRRPAAALAGVWDRGI